MYSDVFCKVYDVFGWNYYPEAFGEQLLEWLRRNQIKVRTSMDLACGTGILCRILREQGIEASGMDFSSGMIDIARQNYPRVAFDVADMITYCPQKQFDLVTCTGDAINHIPSLQDVAKIFRNVYQYTAPGGYFVFDLLNRREISDDEPFEMDFTETTRVWFQMTRPTPVSVNLQVKVYENGTLRFTENIRETVHDPAAIRGHLREAGFRVVRCADSLLDDGTHGTTCYFIAKKEE
jgi:SAM-dependent methyltransferase